MIALTDDGTCRISPRSRSIAASIASMVRCLAGTDCST
ncbi:Uncharacterised protein [Mycobacterium tuberculosis]|nr:Uncharacterised protein [Mycobacterium tuberculosis]